MKVIVRNEDGTETEITEGVQALYDMVIASQDWGSGFWSYEDAVPVAVVARACGFERVDEVERYLNEQLHSVEQGQFLDAHREARLRYPYTLPEHDHVFSSAGRCMWPTCQEKTHGND